MTYIALPISVKLHTQEWECSLWHFHSWKKCRLYELLGNANMSNWQNTTYKTV